MTAAKTAASIRYEPDEPCPAPVSVAVGLQGAVLGLARPVGVGTGRMELIRRTDGRSMGEAEAA